MESREGPRLCDLERSQDQGHKIKTLTLEFNATLVQHDVSLFLCVWGLEEVLDNLKGFLEFLN